MAITKTKMNALADEFCEWMNDMAVKAPDMLIRLSAIGIKAQGYTQDDMTSLLELVYAKYGVKPPEYIYKSS